MVKTIEPKPQRKVIDARYTLSKGCEWATGTPSSDWHDKKERVVIRQGWRTVVLTMGVDCFDTEAEARAAFGARKAKKIESFRKQTAKLEKLAFKVKEG